jgi:hypothetical protein
MHRVLPESPAILQKPGNPQQQTQQLNGPIDGYFYFIEITISCLVLCIVWNSEPKNG